MQSRGNYLCVSLIFQFPILSQHGNDDDDDAGWLQNSNSRQFGATKIGSHAINQGVRFRQERCDVSSGIFPLFFVLTFDEI